METLGFAQVLQFVLSGLTAGSIYGLVALGFTLVFNASGIINFAQGQFVMLGGLLATTFSNTLGWPLVLAVMAAIAVTAGVGALVEVVAIRPLRQAPVFTKIMITLAVGTIMEAVALICWGHDPLFLRPFSGDRPLPFLGASLQPQMLWVLGVGLATMVALQTFYRRTMLGQAMLACSINAEAAASLGVNPQQIVLLAFVLAAGFGAVGGVLIAPITSTSYQTGVLMVLKGFAAAIIGGMGSSLGAVVGGLALGLVESLGTGIVSSGYKDAIALSLLVVFLVLRPQGLLGERG